MRVYIYTLGCRLNQCESEAIADSFLNAGFEVTKKYEDAELIIVNSCTVTSKAEQKARRMIRLFARTAEAIAVTGCYAEVEREEVDSLSDKVEVFSLSEKACLLELPEHIKTAINSGFSLREAMRSFKKRDRGLFDFDPSSFSYHSRGYLKIQDGCDNACGYCRTTIARGPSVWLDSDEVVRRALKLEREGMHEIMLTGVNLTNYDHSGEGLGALMEKLLKALGSDMRLRLSSMEPDHVDDRLLNAVADYRVQPHFHIPIQSASDKVLRVVNRNYSIEHVWHIIKTLRSIKDDPFIACDVIAGLPGEDDDEFMVTYNFMKDVEFAAMHVFPYSPRPETPLYSIKKRPEERVRDERAEMLRKLSAKQSHEYVARQLGKECEILLEKKNEGTTGNYLKGKIKTPEGFVLTPGGLYKGRFSSVFPLEVSL